MPTEYIFLVTLPFMIQKQTNGGKQIHLLTKIFMTKTLHTW